MTNTRQSTDYVFEGKVNVLKSTNKNMFRVYFSGLPVAAQMTKGPGVFRLSYTHSLKLVRLRSTKTDRPTDRLTGRRVAVGHYSRPPAVLDIHSSHW